MSYDYFVMGCRYDGLAGMFTVLCGGGTVTPNKIIEEFSIYNLHL
jgi:hypothetical protein